MSTLTVNFDPDDLADLQRVRALLDRLAGTLANSSDPTQINEVTRQKIIALLRGYGDKRTDYIRAVAAASPGVANDQDLIDIVGSAKAVGGTHSAIERAWRAKGMTSAFIITHASGEASMEPSLATLVLEVLHDLVDEPDPLAVASY